METTRANDNCSHLLVYLKLTCVCRCWCVLQAHTRWWRVRFCGSSFQPFSSQTQTKTESCDRRSVDLRCTAVSSRMCRKLTGWNAKQMLHFSSVAEERCLVLNQLEQTVVESLLPFSFFSAFSQVYQIGCQIKITNTLPRLRLRDTCSVRSAQSNQHLSSVTGQDSAPWEQPLTSVWLRRDGVFLNFCGDFVTQSCCRGNMSHLR